MKIIALDSSGMVASVALATEDKLLAEYSVDYKKTHSQTLLPMLDELKRMTDFDLKETDVIALAAGPGSFTGLRIGAATAKGLGLALNKPVVGITTTDALAYNLYGCSALVCPIMDARRGQVYSAIYEYVKGDSGYLMKNILPTCAVMMQDIIAKLNAIGREVIFLGDGVPIHGNLIKEELHVAYSFAPAHCAMQSAGSVAMLGAIAYKEGKAVNAADFSPEYFRLSQAERELMEKEQGGNSDVHS